MISEKKHIASQILEETKKMPQESLSKVLHFIQFLKSHDVGDSTSNSDSNTFNKFLKELDSSSIMHLEEEFEEYKTRFPRES